MQYILYSVCVGRLIDLHSLSIHKAPMYYRRANAAIIVYDITRQKTFSDAREWVKGEQLCSANY